MTGFSDIAVGIEIQGYSYFTGFSDIDVGILGQALKVGKF